MGTKTVPKTLNGKLVLVLIITILMVTHSHGFQLEIRNELSGRYRRLVYKCWSRDNDLGWRENWPDQQKDWSFAMSLFHTFFYCNFHTGYGRVDTQLVASWEMKEQCGDRSKCTWVVKKDGLYLRHWKTLFYSNKYGNERWNEYVQHDILQKSWS
ncbi:unnamed protein product [Microthlaspi erraticum]|uniref:S-protein homolog n=1 Tax=Microthlaspi erraticum TaxID=1685480 RepID=A0A6D2HVG4_9BRAS|nr:unnamed protein product [Microthlaspi erraticum]